MIKLNHSIVCGRPERIDTVLTKLVPSLKYALNVFDKSEYYVTFSVSGWSQDKVLDLTRSLSKMGLHHKVYPFPTVEPETWARQRAASFRTDAFANLMTDDDFIYTEDTSFPAYKASIDYLQLHEKCHAVMCGSILGSQEYKIVPFSNIMWTNKGIVFRVLNNPDFAYGSWWKKTFDWPMIFYDDWALSWIPVRYGYWTAKCYGCFASHNFDKEKDHTPELYHPEQNAIFTEMLEGFDSDYWQKPRPRYVREDGRFADAEGKNAIKLKEPWLSQYPNDATMLWNPKNYLKPKEISILEWAK